jgi:hypothetical protein
MLLLIRHRIYLNILLHRIHALRQLMNIMIQLMRQLLL